MIDLTPIVNAINQLALTIVICTFIHAIIIGWLTGK